MTSKSTRATAERYIPFPLIKERTSFTIKPHRSARVRPASPRRNACYTQRGGLYSTILLKNNQKELASHPRGARRPKSKPNNLTTRVRPTSLRQSAPKKRSLPPLRKPTTTRVGSTGPVGDAYYKKSWLRTLVVLGDQNRSQTIDRHALGLRAPGETRATHNLTTRVRRTLR